MRIEETIRLKLDTYRGYAQYRDSKESTLYEAGVIKALLWVLGEAKDV